MPPALSLSLLLLMILAIGCNAKRNHHSREQQQNRLAARHRLHLGWKTLPDEPEDSNRLSKQDDQDECHKGALHKCGQTFLRAHKLLSYLDDDLVAFRTRCGVRTAFFECLKTTRERICARNPSFRQHAVRIESEFRKKLTDTLWSTRVCVLGVKSFTDQRH